MTDNGINVRPEKMAIVGEVRERLEGANCAILVEFTGMTVDLASEVRGKLREQNAGMFVCKNRLIGAAVKGQAYADLWDESLNGMTALVTGAGDAVSIAKVVDKVCKDSEGLRVKCAMLDGAGLSADDFAQLAALPSREELYGKLVGTLVAPMRNVVGVLGQKTASIVHVIKAIQDKKEAA